jgi:DNA-binding NarL/FixJ family response regulator
MHEEIFYAERAMRAGARGYVTKRESTHRIVEAIHEVQAGRLYANAELLAKLAERIVGRNQSNQPGSVETLSDRELEVFRRLGEGQANRLIAEELHLSIKTVQAYCARIKGKLDLATASELAREAIRWADQKNRH